MHTKGPDQVILLRMNNEF